MSCTYHYQASSNTLQPQAAKHRNQMAAKAALAFLLLATAAAYSSQRVPIDARRSHVVAAERRRRFNAAAALIGAATVAPSTARAITWKVRAASLHSTSRGDGVEVDLIR